MITLTSIVLLLILLTCKGKVNIIYFIPTLLSFILLLMAWILIYSYGYQPFFLSDELVFLDTEYLKYENGIDRAVWVWINQFIIKIDNWLGLWPLKFINLFFLILLIYSLYKLFQSKIVFWLPVIFLTIPYNAIYNFRDVSIWALTVIFVLSLKEKKFIIALIVFSIMFFIRPLIPLVIILLLGGYYIIKVFKRKKYILDYFLIFMMLLLMAIFYNKITQETAVFLAANDTYNDSHKLLEVVTNMIKYMLLPTPTNVFLGILNGEFNQFGILYSLVNLFSSLTYYFLLFSLMFKLINYKNYRFNIDKYMVLCMLLMFMYFPVYAYYLEGITHNRLRVPFYIFIFLINIVIIKKEDSANENSCSKSTLLPKN